MAVRKAAARDDRRGDACGRGPGHLEIRQELRSQDRELTELECVFLDPSDLSPISSNQQEDFKESEDHSWPYEMSHGPTDVVTEVHKGCQPRGPDRFGRVAVPPARGTAPPRGLARPTIAGARGRAEGCRAG